MNSKHLVGMLVLALLLLSYASVATTTAQTPPAQAPTEQPPKVSKELEQKALVMLDEIIKDTQSYRIPENRLRLRAVAAGLLWKHDEARARILFKETMASIVDLLNDRSEEESVKRHMFQGINQLRREVVQMLASRDPRMAREFLRATQPPGKSQNVSYGRYGELYSDLQMEYGLATKITEKDPKQALEIAEESLAKGFSYELINTLTTLKEKDREAAAKLSRAIVARLRTENLSTNSEAASVASGMVAVVVGGATGVDGKDKKDEPLLDQQGMRDLVEMNVNMALNSPAYTGRSQSLDELLPLVQKYAPARVAEVRRKIAQYKSMTGNPTQATEEETGEVDWVDHEMMVGKGTAEELLAAAAKAEPGMRDHMYQYAAMKFAERGDIDKAREIINTNVSDPSLRKSYLSQLEQQASLTAAEQGKMDQVRKSLANLRTNEEKAQALAQIALAMVAKGEKKIARQLLEEAQALVNYRAKNITQLGAQLLVAQAYAKLNPERSLTMLEPIVDQLNELLAAAVTLGGFILDHEVMQDEEIRMEVLTSVLPFAESYFMADLRRLAISDFDRTRALAERFQRDEVRMLARLLVVNSVIGEPIPATMPDDIGMPGATTVTTTTTTDVPVVKDNDDDDTP